MDIMEEMKKSSMLFWYPKIMGLDIPQPKTEIVKINNDIINVCDGDFSSLEPYMKEINEKCKIIKYPLFMRTDHLSGKHQWKNTCFVENKENLKGNISRLVEDSFIADIVGLPVYALVFREYILMKELFTAFYGDMPVNPEIRFFVKDGEILCKHWYWCNEAIVNPSVDNWKKLMDKEKDEITEKEKQLLKGHALKVAEQFEGYWSVDFCKAKDGTWYLIDCAVGSASWHPKDCINYKKLHVGIE